MTLGWLQILTATLQHTVVFWLIWIPNDIAWRREYQARVSQLTTEPATASESTLLQHAHAAHQARLDQKVKIREVTSPFGRCLIRWFGKKLEPFLFYANKYSLIQDGKPFGELEVGSAGYNKVNSEIQFKLHH